jgi:hypothetical protein
MKNQGRFFLALMLFVFIVGDHLHAANINQTVSFARMQSRAATVNSIDAVYYNPSSLMKLKDGLYLDVGYQVLTKAISHKIFFNNSEENKSSWFIPNCAVVYRQGKGTLFLTLTMPEGFETMHYTGPQFGFPLLAYSGLNLSPVQMDILRIAGLTSVIGSVETPSVSYVNVSKYWLQGRLGGSFSITDAIAFTGGIVCSYYEAAQSAGVLKLGSVYKSEMKAYGWSGFAGITLSSTDTAALTVLYATQVIARGTEHSVKINYSQAMERRLADYILIGLNLFTAEKTSFQISYQVSFSGERKYGTKNILTKNHEFGFLDWLSVYQNSAAWAAMPLISNGNSQNYKYRNRHSIGFGLEIEVNNIFPSLGISYATQEKYPRAQNSFDPDLARIGVGGGVKAKISDSVTMETGSANYFFITDRMLFKSIKLNKTAWTWGIGFTIKLM